jgi:hypothetical protein
LRKLGIDRFPAYLVPTLQRGNASSPKNKSDSHLNSPVEMKNAKKGVFISISAFSSGAREFVSMIEK